MTLHQADLLDQLSLINLIKTHRARRGLQPRGDVVRADVVGAAGADGRVHGARRHAHARGHPPRQPEDTLLPGVVLRDVRQGPRGAAEREDALPPAQPLRRRQGLRPLHHRQLPRVLPHLRGQRHPLQPRVAPARQGVRHAQDHRRRRAHQDGPRQGPPSRQPRRGARLGLRRRLRPGDVAHAPGRTSPTTTSSAPARPTPSASSSRRRSRRPASNGRSTSSSTPPSSVRPRSTLSSPTPRRRTRSSAGAPRSTSKASCA